MLVLPSLQYPPVNWQHPLNRGLISWWKVIPGRRGGGTWRDLCRRNHGTLTNMNPVTDWVGSSQPGSFGALDFDGTNKSISIGQHSDWFGASGSSDNPITISAWARIYSLATAEPIVSTDLGGATAYADMFMFGIGTSNAFNCILYDTAADRIGIEETSAISVNIDYHFVATYDGSGTEGGINLYRNGILATTSSLSTGTYAGINTGSDDWQIGRRWMNTPAAADMNGQVDDVRVYDRELSVAEVWRLYRDSSIKLSPLINWASVPLARVPAAAAGPTIRQGLQAIESGVVNGLPDIEWGV